MAEKMHIEESAHFRKIFKKLNKNQQLDVEQAIFEVWQNPALGTLKSGDLRAIRVYKFRMVKQLTLLAYRYYDARLVIELLKFGPHENFYDELKNQLH